MTQFAVATEPRRLRRGVLLLPKGLSNTGELSRNSTSLLGLVDPKMDETASHGLEL